jgi:tetratricopeptide (TPR) repeat protein
MKKYINKCLSSAAFILFLFLVLSCELIPVNLIIKNSEIDRYYITGSKENREYFKELFNLLNTEEQGSEGEFTVTREIAASFIRLKDYDRLIHFLTEKVIGNQSDPYNSYYLLMIAYGYIQQGSEPIAALYFDQIIMKYPDFIVNDESIHLVCLRQLINLNRAPERQVYYYQELISRYPDKIDIATAYFMQGQYCEQIGDWNGAIQAYSNYLPYSGTIISGYPNAEHYARQKVDFDKSAKDWTFENLPALRTAVEDAIDAGSPRQLSRYQAKVNFFGRSWGQTEGDDARMVDFNLAEFMYNNKISYASSLDSSSNATEAYLRTTGWSTYMSTWYLYFRKIHFPQDPEIHGRWEWAGIYYGEKF